MEIELEKIIPEGWIVHRKKGEIRVGYLSKRGNYNRKMFEFPRKIKIDEGFIEAIALYWGDGDYNKKDKAHLGFYSKDKDLARRFLYFLRYYFKLQDKDLTISIVYKKGRQGMVKEWAHILKIGEEKLLTRKARRYREECCQIQVNGVVFRKIFELIFEKIINSKFIQKRELRRAFLRGIFAAEGCVGVDGVKEKPYINQVTFSIAIQETFLRKTICKSLKLERIRYRIERNYEDNSLNIHITNWENYMKLWGMTGFDLCERKKNRFREIAKRLDVYIKLNSRFRDEFFTSLNLNQRKIAKIIGSWQANVCRTLQGDHLLRIEQIDKLIPYSNFERKEILRNVDYLRIGSQTKILPDDGLDFLKEFKSIE